MTTPKQKLDATMGQGPQPVGADEAEVKELRRGIITAIMGLLETREIPIEPRPTIADLEKILNSEDPMRVTIKPDGSVVELVPAKTTVGAVADLIVTQVAQAFASVRRQQIERDAEIAEAYADQSWGDYATDHKYAAQTIAYTIRAQSHGEG